MAVEKNRIDICHVLLDAGADVNMAINQIGASPLHLATRSHVSLAIFKILTDNGGFANMNITKKQSILHNIVSSKCKTIDEITQQYEKLHFILQHGAVVDENCLHAFNLMLFGEFPENPEFHVIALKMLELLVEHGININARLDDG